MKNIKSRIKEIRMRRMLEEALGGLMSVGKGTSRTVRTPSRQVKINPRMFDTRTSPAHKQAATAAGAEYTRDPVDWKKSGWALTQRPGETDDAFLARTSNLVRDIGKLKGETPDEVIAVIEFLKAEFKKAVQTGQLETDQMGEENKNGAVVLNPQEVLQKLNEMERKIVSVTSAKEFQDFMRPILAMKQQQGAGALNNNQIGLNYSLLNLILIRAQDPKARFVAGKTLWKAMHREVLPNAPVLAMWGPSSSGISYQQAVRQYCRKIGKYDFKKFTREESAGLNKYTRSVMNGRLMLIADYIDIRFTKPMEGVEDYSGAGTEVDPSEVEKGRENIKKLVWFDDDQNPTPATIEIGSALEKVCENNNVPVKYKEIKDGARGYTDGRTITLISGRKVTFDFLKTNIHELTHALCHFGKQSKYGEVGTGSYAGNEQQAEICAWIVCYLFGYEDPKNTALNYAGAWGVADPETAVKVFKKVNSVANKIYTEIIQVIMENRRNGSAVKTVNENLERRRPRRFYR